MTLNMSSNLRSSRRQPVASNTTVLPAQPTALSASSAGKAQPQNDNSGLLQGKYAQKLIACNQKLKSLGLDETIRLPQLCVIGDQSTGKSSLIEAISTIKVPKAKGCCTQCPIAINLSSSAPNNPSWTCTVSIEYRYDYDETSKKITKKNPFGPWRERNEIKVVHFATTSNQDEVEDQIRSAQHAVLNPTMIPRDASSSSDTPSIKFSPNVIRLDVSDKDWPNLSFVDLPGVIANTSKADDKYLVELIENLVKHYAKVETGINILTLPMTHDLENSRACGLIQDMKVESRTLAVFTKPDLADDDQRAPFLDKFQGKDTDLNFDHGYHVVMLVEDADCHRARIREQEFFSGEPWDTLQDSCRARLGVRALNDYLREVLFQKTEKTLPGNLKAIEARLLQVDYQLKLLPAPERDDRLPYELRQEIVDFGGCIEGCFTEDGPVDETRREWLDGANKFRANILAAKPMVVLQAVSDTNEMRAAQRKVNKLHPRIVQEISDDEDEAAVSVKSERAHRPSPTPYHTFRLEDIRSINQEKYNACIPGETNPHAFKVMVKLSLERWADLLDAFMYANQKLLLTQLVQLTTTHFSKFAHLKIYQAILCWVEGYVQKALANEKEAVEGICSIEQNHPLTLDEERIKQLKDKYLEERTVKRNEVRIRLMKLKAEARGATKREIDAVSISSLGPDAYEVEISMSARARAYYDIVSARFTDNVVQHIFAELLPRCGKPLIEQLKEHIGVGDPARFPEIVVLMTEDPTRDAQRQKLVREREQLQEGYHYIRNALSRDDADSPTVSPSKRRFSSSTEADTTAHDSPPKRSKRRRDHDLPIRTSPVPTSRLDQQTPYDID